MSDKTIMICSVWGGTAIMVSVALLVTGNIFALFGLLIAFLATIIII